MKGKKICLLILILTLIIVIFPTISNAIDRPPKPSGSSSTGNSSTGTFNPDDYEPDNLKASDVKEFGEYGGRVAGIIRVVGTIVSVGALMIIGIRFMLGSAEEKAEYKDRMFPYVIGAILLFGASNLVDIIYRIVRSV